MFLPVECEKPWKSCEDLVNINMKETLLHHRDTLLLENIKLKNINAIQETQLTELHSVVAELRKQLESFHDKRILEEDEDESDDYFEDGILMEEFGSGSEHSECSGGDERIVDVGGGGVIRSSDTSMSMSTSTTTLEQTNENKLSRILAHLQSIQKEHNHIKETLQDREAQLKEASSSLKQLKSEKDALVKKVGQLQQLLPSRNNNGSNPTPTHCRYAARRKLQTYRGEEAQKPTAKTHLTGPTLISIANSLNTCIVEKLVNLNEAAALGELQCSSRTELELILEKESLKVDKLQNEVDFLLGRLSEAKSVNEELVTVVGRVESWGMGWKVVADRGDSTIECYDILVALLESELGLLLANVKAAGIGSSSSNNLAENMNVDSIESLLKRAEFNRQTAMGAALRVVGNVNNNKEQKVGPRLLEHQIRSLIISLKTTTAQLTSTIPDYDFNMTKQQELGHNDLKRRNCNKIDLETAVLMQELLSCREEKAELKMRLFCVERERDFLATLVQNGGGGGGGGTGNNELNNNETNSSYSLLHESNSLLLKSLEDTKTKYTNRVKLLEDRILLLMLGRGGGGGGVRGEKEIKKSYCSCSSISSFSIVTLIAAFLATATLCSSIRLSRSRHARSIS